MHIIYTVLKFTGKLQQCIVIKICSYTHLLYLWHLVCLYIEEVTPSFKHELGARV